ncbi:MAG: Rieske (2Fe-2S) protein [Deltaproteobacteria bacterium]|nr:Rieske (2Fe-2S) protein [Deltaproteobacteria bacterium]
MTRDSRPKPVTVDRRGFLVAGGSACALVVAGLYGCEGEEGDGNELVEGQFPVGHVDDFPLGSVTRFLEGPFFVLRDEEGLWALTAVCTHQQCVVDEGTDQLPCPCHGSVFDLDGGVVQGPAVSPLDNLSVVVDEEGAVTVDTAQTVSSGTRTPVE